jgi:hypothetical protein
VKERFKDRNEKRCRTSDIKGKMKKAQAERKRDTSSDKGFMELLNTAITTFSPSRLTAT